MELMEDNVYAPPKADLTPKRQTGEMTALMVDNLQVAARWARALSILGYFFMVAIVVGVAFFWRVLGLQTASIDTIELVIYIMGALVSLFFIFKISRFLQKYAYFNRQLAESNDVLDLIEGQEYFRRYTQWFAISLGIAIVFSLLAISYIVMLRFGITVRDL